MSSKRHKKIKLWAAATVWEAQNPTMIKPRGLGRTPRRAGSVWQKKGGGTAGWWVSRVQLGRLCRREEPVEVEGQGVELFVPVVSSEGPELHPPGHPSVLLGLLHLQGVVQEDGHHQADGRRRQEDRVQEPIELPARPRQKKEIFRSKTSHDGW